MTTLTFPDGAVHFGQGFPTLLINDQLRVLDQKAAILEQLQTGNLDGLLELARFGRDRGLEAADLLIQSPELDEVQLLPRLAARILNEVGCPVALDTRNPEALEAALQAIRPHKALINSISAEPEVLNSLLPLAHKYGAAFVGMPVGHTARLPMTCAERLAEAQIIVDAATGLGIPKDDIVLDGICLAAATGDGTFEVTLETLWMFHAVLDCTTLLGIGNAGFGMPEQTVIDLAYLVGAIPHGLDAALVDPNTAGLLETVRAMDFLAAKDPAGKRYLQHYRRRRTSAAEAGR
jgi:5-methyltetrahydrofolate--homocysteine methyltransferase